MKIIKFLARWLWDTLALVGLCGILWSIYVVYIKHGFIITWIPR